MQENLDFIHHLYICCGFRKIHNKEKQHVINLLKPYFQRFMVIHSKIRLKVFMLCHRYTILLFIYIHQSKMLLFYFKRL